MNATAAPRSERGKSWAPHAGPQTRFLASRAKEALFGGAAGGGKSDCLLIGALRYIHEPSYRALLLRRTFPELERNLIARSWQYYPALGGRYNSQRHDWTFPSRARVIFASMEHENDKHNFKSDEYQYIGFDELTSFEETQYVYMMSRMRSAQGLPCRMRGGTNPGGDGHRWVRQRFAPWLFKPGEELDEYSGPYGAPGELLWFRRDENTDVETVVPEGTPGSISRTFFPATHRDNPTLTTNDPDYVHVLGQLDRLTRRQLRDGDWAAKPAAGEFFQRGWFEVLDRVPHDARIIARIRYWDRAGSIDGDWTAGTMLSKDTRGIVYVEHVHRFRAEPAGVESKIDSTADEDDEAFERQGRVTQVLEEDPGQAGKFEVHHYVTHTLAGHAVKTVRPTGDKVTRAKPASAQAEHGNVKVIRGPWNRAWFDELESFPEGTFDDQVDSLSGGYSVIASVTRTASATAAPRAMSRAGAF